MRLITNDLMIGCSDYTKEVHPYVSAVDVEADVRARVAALMAFNIIASIRS